MKTDNDVTVTFGWYRNFLYTDRTFLVGTTVPEETITMSYRKSNETHTKVACYGIL